MPKNIKLVEDVMRKSAQTGRAKKGPYVAEYANGDVRLFHYGTLIFESRQGQITRLGGYSGSDRDAISTAMTVTGNRTYVSNAKKYQNKNYRQMNGWYIIPY